MYAFPRATAKESSEAISGRLLELRDATPGPFVVPRTCTLRIDAAAAILSHPMTIAPGSRLGPYEITSAIGAGGMGEVWRGKDTRLAREVAIKVLPPGLTSNEQLRARFEREAKAISSLNHPHICTLHDIGHDGGHDYLVMELLEGESLADRLQKGPLPPEQLIRLGAQIALALDAAHRQGITHRDLKPGNIMLTKSGAKLLDFGLAKMAAEGEAWPAAGLTDLLTAQKPLTQEGTILGTFQYMAPEQLEGNEAGARTDIFALGAVLYEMATGRRAFQGSSKTSLIAAIVSSQPEPVSTVAPMTPPALDHVIRRCLAKDPDERWQSAHDVATELQWIGEAGSSAGVAAPKLTRRKSRERVAWGLVALLAVAGGWHGWVEWRSRGENAPRVVRFSIPSEAGSRLGMLAGNHVAISPDGSTILRYIVRGGLIKLIVRRLDSGAESAFDLPAGGHSFFFSPDGLSVGFFSGGKLKRLELGRGAIQDVCDVFDGRGGAWAPDGTIYYTPAPAAGLWKVPAGGGTPRVVTTPDPAAGENSHRWVDLLPDGKHALVTVRTQKIDSFDQAKIAVVSLEDGKLTTIVDGGAFARYVEPGLVIFTRASGLYAAPFDSRSLKVTGPVENVLDGVTHYLYTGGAEWAVSRRGDLVYVPGATVAGRTEFDVFDRSGTIVRHLASVGDTAQWTLSPDGSRVAMTISAANDDVWVQDLERGTLTRLTFEPGDEGMPVWTRDGRSVIYPRGDRRALLKRAADGTGAAEMLLDPKALVDCGSVSPDGTTLAYTMFDQEKGTDIWLLSLDGKRASKLFIQTPFEEYWPRFSPDGRWLAYVSQESGRSEVYVSGMNDEGRWQVSNGGGDLPEWSPRGSELFFVAKDKLWASSISQGQKLAIGKPVELFDIGIGLEVPIEDGRHFIIGRQSVDDRMSGVNVVVFWVDELKRRQKSN
jgi:hypothetical protein